MALDLDSAIEGYADRRAHEGSAEFETAFLSVREGQSLVVRKNGGADVGARPRINFIEGANVTLSIVDDGVQSEIDITIAAAAPSNSVTVRKNSGADVGARPRLNLIEGSGVTLTISDDAGSGEVDITIAASGGPGGVSGDIQYNNAGAFGGLTSTGTGNVVRATSPAITTPTGIVKGDVGLGNVDNTSDAAKPVSTATQTALDAKQPLDSDLTAIAALSPSNDDILQRKGGAWTNRTPAQLKTDLALVKADVGLANVANVDTTNAANISSGTLPDGRFPATLPVASGVNLTALNASNLSSGTAPTARLGSGTADSTKHLRGDSTWAVTPVDNSSSQSVLASTFTISTASGTYADTGLSVTLPSAGTYLVQASVRTGLKFSVGTVAFMVAKLHNSTDAADVTDSETFLDLTETSGKENQQTTPVSVIITVAASKTLKLYVKRDGATTYTTTEVYSDVNGRTRMSYVRLS